MRKRAKSKAKTREGRKNREPAEADPKKKRNSKKNAANAAFLHSPCFALLPANFFLLVG